MNEKILVIYHRADFDGIFCREIAKRFLGDTALYVGLDYGDSDAIVPPGIETIYMLDISIEAWMKDPRLIWIDHHKTAFKKFGTSIPGYQIDGVAACRLAWQWFSIIQHNAQNRTNEALQVPLPSKQDFIDRKVDEPYAVQLAGEYDIWDKRNPEAELFQHGLRSQDLTEHIWEGLLDANYKDGIFQSAKTTRYLIEDGRAIQYSKTKENEGIIRAFGFTIQFEGFTLLACNTARYNSQLFAAGLLLEHDGCLGFNWDGQKQEWRVSLYSDKPGVDLSVVAVKYGGGGHRGACGFRSKTLPFIL